MRFKGKTLVRRGTANGRPVIILCGVFVTDVDAEEFDARDEMWGVELEVVDSARIANESGLNVSPEDFLENVDGCQDANRWRRRNP